MAMTAVVPSGRERTFAVDDIIVSKTDLKGRITYANRVFVEVSGYSEEQLLGQPHNLIRHPDMPGAVFKLLWDTIADGREVFAYVINMAANGDHYWVHAHVTPSRDDAGQIIGYHSNRRVPRPEPLQVIRPLYAELLAEEERHAKRTDAIAASTALLTRRLHELGMSYEELIWKL